MWEQVKLSTLKLVEADKLINYGQLALKAVMVFLVARLIIYLSYRLVDRIMVPISTSQQGFSRAKTLSSLMKSVLRYGIFFVVAVTILDIFDINVGGFVATASILGVAIGFGAQSLIKDVLTGFFIIFENQFGVGETISVLGLTGKVEDLGLRLTKLRDGEGQLHIIPNGQIGQITNYNRGSMQALVDIRVPYGEDLDQVWQMLDRVCWQCSEDMAEVLVENPKVLGIQAFNLTDQTLRIIARAKPMEQWGVERKLRKLISEAFRDADKNIPYHTGEVVLREQI